MLPIILAGVAAYVILAPRVKAQARGPAIRAGAAGLGARFFGGSPSSAPIDNGTPQVGLATTACSIVTGVTTKYVTGSAEMASQAAQVDQRLANPVCYYNVKAAEYGVQAGRAVYDYSKEAISSVGSAIKGIF